MGVLKHLLFWPVTGPVALAKFSVRQVEGVARHELTDDGAIHEELMALQMELELGSIDEAEYERREAVVMERLREARAWRERLGMEEAWEPLGFSRQAPERTVEDGGRAAQRERTEQEDSAPSDEGGGPKGSASS